MLFKRGHIILTILILSLTLVSAYIFNEFVKQENFVVKEINVVNDMRYLTLKSNKTFHPSVKSMLAKVDEHTEVIDQHSVKSSNWDILFT